jgi:hypothetical protein
MNYRPEFSQTIPNFPPPIVMAQWRRCQEKPMTDTAALPTLAYSVAQLVKATSIGRTKIFEDIAKGRLHATHVGGRTVITVEDARAWLANASREHKLDHQPKPRHLRPPAKRFRAQVR